MAVTPFEPKQKEISDKVHFNNRDVIYPRLFGVAPEAITYDDLPEDFRDAADCHLSADCFLNVKFKGLRSAMRFLVSYRFREDQYRDFQDVTFTEYNHASDLPSELYKMAVQYFTYGYYNKDHKLVEVIVIDVPLLKKAIIDGRIQPSHDSIANLRSYQTFVSYSFADLKRLELVSLHLIGK